MKRLFVLLALFALGCEGRVATQGGYSSVRPYRFIQVVEPSTLEQKLNEVAAEGYRMAVAVRSLQASWAAVMESVDAAQTPYKYLVIGRKEGEDFQAKLNAAATQGFRLVSRSRAQMPVFDLAVMEKEPGERPLKRYLVIGFGVKEAAKGIYTPSMWLKTNPLEYVRGQVEAALKDGYRIERIESGSLIMMEGEVMGRTLDPAGRQEPNLRSAYHTLGNAKPDKLRKRLKKEADSGYTIVDLAPTSLPTWPAVLFQNDALGGESNSSGREYQVFQSAPVDLQKSLNGFADAGYRLLPQVSIPALSLANARAPIQVQHCRLVMEKSKDDSLHYRYLVMITQRISNLDDSLSATAQQGFHLVSMSECESYFTLLLEAKAEVKP